MGKVLVYICRIMYDRLVDLDYFPWESLFAFRAAQKRNSAPQLCHAVY